MKDESEFESIKQMVLDMNTKIEKYTNDYGKECYKGVDEDSEFSKDFFHKTDYRHEDDEHFAFHSNLGSLTVVDRMTGFGGGLRDIESGYRNKAGEFWLASGGFDVRVSCCKTVGEAIDWVKSNANTCVPK